MAKVLVTGGCGFIGSHTVVLLLELGYEVVILDSNINSSPNVVRKIKQILNLKKLDVSKNLEFFQGDIRNQAILEKIFLESTKKGKIIEGVIHFSGLKSVGESNLLPLTYWDVNLAGSITLFKVMEKFNCRKLIFSSSASIYGESKNFPFKENTVPNPLNPYANTKLTVEKILKDICKSDEYSWNVINLRYFNPIGAHSSGILGEEPLGEPQNLFPLILRSSINANKKIFIYGNDWPTFDGTCVRDYIHIEDLAEGHIAALKSVFLKDKGYKILNLGTGKGTSVLELIKIFELINSVKISYEFFSRRDGDCPVLIADNSSALENINWSPKRNIEDMCKDGFNWFLKRQNKKMFSEKNNL